MDLPDPLERLVETLRTASLRAFRSRGMAYVFLGLLVLYGLLALLLLGALLWIIWSVASHGAGSLWNSIPLVWLVGLWMMVPLGIGWLWIQFFRGDRQGLAKDPRLEAAERGEADAILALAETYRGTDPVSARAWLLQGARAGNPVAMRELARDLMEGRGGVRDLVTAEVWAARAEALGDPVAPSLLKVLKAKQQGRFSESEEASDAEA